MVGDPINSTRFNVNQCDEAAGISESPIFQLFAMISVSLSMEPYAIIDESSFPLVRITFTGSKSTDQNFQTYLDQNKDCYRHKLKLAIIFDASNASIPALSHQKLQAKWLKDHNALMQAYCMGTAYIIPNIAVRAILNMIFSMQKQPVPYKIVKSQDEAANWVASLPLISD
jgi:hypothetical protein